MIRKFDSKLKNNTGTFKFLTKGGGATVLWEAVERSDCSARFKAAMLIWILIM